MVEDGDGVIRVLEVDAWAGFAGITRVTGTDVAGGLLDFATPDGEGRVTDGRRMATGRARRMTKGRGGGMTNRGGCGGMTLGVARNPYATNVADRLIATAGRLGVPARLIDLPSLGLSVQPRES